MAEIIQFPKRIEEIFLSLDKDRIIQGKANVNESKFNAFCSSLRAINEYGEYNNFPVKIMADDPRIHYTSHSLVVYFETNEFEDEEIEMFSRIISGFDTLTFLQSETGDITVLLIMEDIYTEKAT